MKVKKIDIGIKKLEDGLKDFAEIQQLLAVGPRQVFEIIEETYEGPLGARREE